MNVCLATVHATPRFIPLALLYLKAQLVQTHGYPADAIDIAEFNPGVKVEALVTRILERSPDVVGLSCYVWNIKILRRAARRIKELRPGVRVVLGGPEVGPVAESVMNANPDVDAVVRSEGEMPFSELVACWHRGGDPSGVRGICFRSGSGIVETADAPVVKDLNVLASPHLSPYMDYTGRFVCIETQRGCVFRCNFCFYNKDYSIRNRRFDLARVKEEILYWLERDVSEIFLMDPVFNLYADRAKDICRFIAAHNHRRVPIHAEVWAEFIDDELARLMRDAHFEFLEVGLQTTDSDVLATVERRLKLQKFLDGVGHLKEYGLPFELQLIYGLPGETVQTFRKSLDFAASLDPPSLAVFPLMVLPGTELWRKADGFRLEYDAEPPYYVTSHFSMSTEDIAYGWKVHDALDDIADAKTFRLLSREPGLTFSQVVDSWVTWQDGRPEDEPHQEKVRQFLTRFCDERQIPSVFYQGFASMEFGGPSTPSPAAV
jgi:anaerobic magnesium-protoporphyrin IX monomethyl ester cyclase